MVQINRSKEILIQQRLKRNTVLVFIVLGLSSKEILIQQRLKHEYVQLYNKVFSSKEILIQQRLKLCAGTRRRGGGGVQRKF